VVDGGSERGWGGHSGNGTGLWFIVVVRQVGVGRIALGQDCGG
jgi:hypothetical protein